MKGRRATKGLVAKVSTDFRNFDDNRTTTEALLEGGAREFENLYAGGVSRAVPGSGRTLSRMFAALREAVRSDSRPFVRSACRVAAALVACAIENAIEEPTERDPADIGAAAVSTRLAFWIVARLIDGDGGLSPSACADLNRLAGSMLRRGDAE